MAEAQQSLHRPFRPAAHKRRRAGGPAWPTFTGTAQQVGTSHSGVTVWVDPTLGAPGLQNANDLLADADRIVGANNGFFGSLGGPVNVLVYALNGATDGTGGADHMACDFVNGGNIEVDASFGNSARVSALFEAELSECSMGGNLCGVSTGEALSRWCAMQVSGNALGDFASAPTWVQDGEPNFVDNVDPTDQNYDSIGCGMAFLSWLISLGYPLGKIAQAMVVLTATGTLAQLYAQLTGDAAANAWPKFQTAVANVDVTSDDPFGAAVPAPAPPPPAPPPVPQPTGQSLITILGTIVSQVPQAHRIATVVVDDARHFRDGWALRL